MSDILDTRFEDQDVDIDDNLVEVGDDLNLLEKDPALRNISIGVGWDLNAFDSDALDLDVSVFLLNKDGQTRVDEDFVFYNQSETLEGAIKHGGDNRTGAGDGDDETIFVDLQGIPFDILQIVIVLSIYKGVEKGQSLESVRNGYVRIVNVDTTLELCRFKLDSLFEDKTERAAIIGEINREGPKWHFKPQAEMIEKGLGEIAGRYGLIINQE